MATLASGTSTTITLIAGQTLTVLPGGSGLLTTGAGHSPRQLGGTPVTVGPYKRDVTVLMTANSALTYSVTASSGYVGQFDTLASLQAAFSNPATGSTANVIDSTTGGVTGYRYGGSTLGWVSTTGGGSATRTLIPASYTLASTDNGKVLETTGGTVTVPASLGVNFSCVIDVVSGTVNVARSGAATLNGAATTLTRASRQMFSVNQCLTGSPNDYTVTGA